MPILWAALRTLPDGARIDDESAEIFVTVGDEAARFLDRLRAHGDQPACFIGIDFDIFEFKCLFCKMGETLIKYRNFYFEYDETNIIKDAWSDSDFEFYDFEDR